MCCCTTIIFSQQHSPRLETIFITQNGRFPLKNRKSTTTWSDKIAAITINKRTTTVHYLKFICDRRCAIMSFFFHVWIIHLNSKGYRITEAEKKNRPLTHPLCSLRTAWIQDLPSISSRKSLCRIITLLV